MSRRNLSKSLLDRELGQNSALSGFDQPVWSFLVSSRKDRQEFQFSNSSKIFSIQFKENYLVVLTKNSDCFVLNTLERITWYRILNSHYQVLKATILDNNCLFLVSKRVSHENLKFFIIQNPCQVNQPIQVLTDVHATLENLKECDIYFNKLVICINNIFQVYDLISFNLLFQSSSPHCYSRDHVASIKSDQNHLQVLIRNLKYESQKTFTITNCIHIELIEIFRNFFVFSHQNRLCFGDLVNGETGVISAMPRVYFVGQNMSAAVFENYMILMNSKWSRVDLVPSVFCADSVGILVLYEDFNMNIVIVKDDGLVLRTVPIEAKVMYIAVNQETTQLVVACKNIVHIFD